MLIHDHRRRIDELDRELVRLLNRRAQMSIQLGQLKKDVGLPMRDQQREDEILRNTQRRNPGPLDEQALASIYRTNLEESRRFTGEIMTRTAETREAVAE